MIIKDYINISKTSKMPCGSWSLQAVQTCPGARNAKGELVTACAGCYANKHTYNFKNVKKARADNFKAWKREEFTEDMTNYINLNERFFRWFDSGDIYHKDLAWKIYEICKNTPHCNHWIPTRSYKVKKIKPILDRMNELENVVVRFSSDSIKGGLDLTNIQETEKINGLYKSTIYGTAQELPKNAHPCKAYENAGKCGVCRKCWDKSVKNIAYKLH
tara:strand:- start:290 stop:940 length:651 start_codon:yes stop_codon:yes gene_type:complete